MVSVIVNPLALDTVAGTYKVSFEQLAPWQQT